MQKVQQGQYDIESYIVVWQPPMFDGSGDIVMADGSISLKSGLPSSLMSISLGNL